jgi:hypothetical protein
MTPSAAAATRSVPVEKSGVGSAVLNSARQVGGTMGVAIMGAIMASEAGGERTPEAFMKGFEAALLVAAAIALVGAIVAFTLVRPHEGAGDRGRRPSLLVRTCRPVDPAPGRFIRPQATATRGASHRNACRVSAERVLKPGPGDSLARRPVSKWCTQKGALKHRYKNCGSGVSFEATPSRGWRAGESWLCGPATLISCPPTDPAVVPAHPIWRPIVCGVGLTIGAVSEKVK